MTPERANEIAYREWQIEIDGETTLEVVVRAILAACAEERHAALTEAANLCVYPDWDQGNVVQKFSDGELIHSSILALRDREQL